MEAKQSSDEITMGKLTQSIRSIYYAFIILLYRFFKFLLRNWIVLMVIILVGIGLGIWKNSTRTPKLESTLSVQINYKSANQIYQLVEDLNEQIKNDQTSTLSIYHFIDKNQHSLLKEIEIEPVISVVDILQQIPENNRNLELMMDETNFKGDLLKSEVFLPLYRIHRLKIKVADYVDQEKIIEDVLFYLNSEVELQALKSTHQENLSQKIRETELTISGIDSIIKRYGSTATPSSSSGQIYVNTNDNSITDLHLILQEKERAIAKLEDLKIDRHRYEEAVVLLNRPLFHKSSLLLSNKAIVYPVLLVFIFLFISWLIHSFQQAKIHLKEKDFKKL